MGKLIRIDNALYVHFITFSCYHRRRLLDHDQPKRILLGVLEEKLTYMHLNPVRAGLVTTATQWRWSSARWYIEGRTVGVPIQWAD
jgi:REP element-mobilizing transposase RayT